MTNQTEKSSMHVSIIGWVISIVMLAALIIVIATNLGTAEKFVQLVENAQPWWIALALFLQIGTYVCAGAIWREVTLSGGHHLHLRTLARLSVEQLSMNQLVPTGGMAGSLLVIRAMRRRGVPAWLAMEALLVDILSHYAAFAAASFLSLLTLFLSYRATSMILGLIGILSVVLTAVPLGIWWLLRHRTWSPPAWLARRESISRLMAAAAQVSPERVLAPVLLMKTTLLRMGIFVLDAGTLLVMMRAIGMAISPVTAFAAIVTASTTGTISFLPGGIGGFEAGCTATLTLLGTPVEAALTGTLLLRGVTLWLPLIPGWILARQEISHRR